MYTEQLALGGAKTVRGYAPNAAVGSQGMLVANEVWTPVLNLGKLASWSLPVEASEQIGLFLDYCHVAQPHLIPGAANHADLASVGPTLHVTADRYLDLTYDAGWQLRTAPGATNRGVFCDILLSVGF
jgi:hemolysin activation/secretion protein